VNKPFRIVLFLGIIIILLELVKIQLLNNLSVENVDYNHLLQETADLHKINMTLKDQYLFDASYHTVWQKASQEGFIAAPFIYLQNAQ